MTWTKCNHDCDPQERGSRTDGAWHYSNCPVWTYLGVDPAEVHAQTDQRDYPPVQHGERPGGDA